MIDPRSERGGGGRTQKRIIRGFRDEILQDTKSILIYKQDTAEFFESRFPSVHFLIYVIQF